MELALNVTWLCLALAGFALLVVNLSWATKQAEQQPSNRQKIMAMTCALIILFFVVSMTDDLHDQEIFVEESKFQKVIAGAGTVATAATHSAVAPPLFLYLGVTSSPFTLSLPMARRLLEPLGFSFTAAVDSESMYGRAPPSLPA